MFVTIRFLFVFSLGWICAVWIYNVQFPVKSLQDLVHYRVEQFKNFELLGMRLFETPQNNKDISLPKELKP